MGRFTTAFALGFSLAFAFTFFLRDHLAPLLPDVATEAASAVIQSLLIHPLIEGTEKITGSYLTTAFGLIFLILFLAKYIRLGVMSFAFFTYRPIAVPVPPHFTPTEHVVVIIPSLLREPLKQIATIKSILRNNPRRILISIPTSKVHDARALMRDEEHGLGHLIDEGRIVIVASEVENKKGQLLTALKTVGEGKFVVFCDDDVLWPERTFLPKVIAPFCDDRVAAVGPSQRTVRLEKPTMTNFLGISYLEKRTFNTVACSAIDGGISTLSGRTQVIRRSVVQTEEFYDFFVKNKVADDKTLTRWLYRQPVCNQIAIQMDEDCTILTILNLDTTFYTGQCVRWEQGKWLSNGIVMKNESYWLKMRWTLFAVYLWNYVPPAAALDPFMAAMLFVFLSGMGTSTTTIRVSMFAFSALTLSSKVVKLIPHFWHYPTDVKFIPVSIVFGYVHGLTIRQWGYYKMRGQTKSAYA